MTTPKTADDKPRRGFWPFAGESSDNEVETEDGEPGTTARKGRATPGRRNHDEDEGNIVSRGANGIRDYFEGVVAELQKVTWPTREEARRMSTIVLVTTLLASLILGLVALGYSELFQVGLRQPLVFLAFFVIVLVLGFVIYRRSSGRSTPSAF